MNNSKENLDLVILGGDVVLPDMTIKKQDIGVRGSKISILGDLTNYPTKKKINAENLKIIPGVIDTQVHFREPGLTHKEDIFHGTKGAVLGGVTSIFEMPNTKPPTICKNEFKKKLKIAEKNGFCNYSFFIGASKENIDKLNELESLEGCCGVKIFMGSSTGDLLVENDFHIEKILSKAKKMIAIHSEDEFRLRERKLMFENEKVDVSYHPIIRDVESAVRSTQRLIKLAKSLNKKIHILHLSTANEVKILKANKDIATCEVTPQHLFFSAPECYKTIGSFAQMNPPIRDSFHKKELWKGLNEKVIDVIGSDHAPHTVEEKKKNYPASPSGMTGVQTLLPIMLNFVNQKKLTIFDLVQLTSVNPSKIYKIRNKGEIKLGYDADLTIIDMDKEFTITNQWIQSKSGWTPYHNLKIKGMPVHTIVNGNLVVKDGKVISKPVGRKIIFCE